MSIPESSSFWSVVIADPGATNLFAGAVYDRGAATIHTLREKIGDDDFFAGTEQWLQRYDDGTASTDQFEAIFEEVSGEDLTAFFDV